MSVHDTAKKELRVITAGMVRIRLPACSDPLGQEMQYLILQLPDSPQQNMTKSLSAPASTPTPGPTPSPTHIAAPTPTPTDAPTPTPTSLTTPTPLQLLFQTPSVGAFFCKGSYCRLVFPTHVPSSIATCPGISGKSMTSFTQRG